MVIGSVAKGPKKLTFDQEYKCPTDITKNVWLNKESVAYGESKTLAYGDTFSLTQDGMNVEVERTDNGDRTQGWGMDLKIKCCKNGKYQ